MKMRLKGFLFSITLSTMPAAHSSEMINLPEPSLESDYSIEQAIHNRRSVRGFSNKPLSLAEVSQLLWSAQGTTDNKGLRSAPSAGGLYPLVLYLVAGYHCADNSQRQRPQVSIELTVRR